MGSPTNLNKILLCQLVNQTFQDILPMMSSVPLLYFQILSKEENEIMDSIYLQIESAKIILLEIHLSFAIFALSWFCCKEDGAGKFSCFISDKPMSQVWMMLQIIWKFLSSNYRYIPHSTRSSVSVDLHICNVHIGFWIDR